MPILYTVLIDLAENRAQTLLQDDYQVHHGGIDHFQFFPASSEDRPSIPLLPSTKCATDYEN